MYNSVRLMARSTSSASPAATKRERSADAASRRDRTAQLSVRRTPRLDPAARRRWLQFGLAFVTALLVLTSLVGDRGLFATLRVKREHAELASSIADQRQRNRELLETARRLREDPKAIEDAARRDLGLMREGEVLFIIKDSTAPPERGEVPAAPQAPADQGTTPQPPQGKAPSSPR